MIWLLLVASTCVPERTPPEGIFVRDGRGVLHGPYASVHAHNIATNHDAQVFSLDARPVAVGYAVAPDLAAAGVFWFIRCPDGLIRGPISAEVMRKWLVNRFIPPSAPAYAGRVAVHPDPPGQSSAGLGHHQPESPLPQQPLLQQPPRQRLKEQDEPQPQPDIWKSTWRKHLRPHRWRAMRLTFKLGKSAARKSKSAVSSVAPIVKTWQDEEAEWAAIVTRAHAQHRPPIPKSRSQPPSAQSLPPANRQRHAKTPKATSSTKTINFRSVDASKQLDPSAAWRDDARSALANRLKQIKLVSGLAVLVLTIVAACVAASLEGVVPTPQFLEHVIHAAQSAAAVAVTTTRENIPLDHIRTSLSTLRALISTVMAGFLDRFPGRLR